MTAVRLIIGIPLLLLLALLVKRIAHRWYHRRRQPHGVPTGYVPDPAAPWPEIARFALGYAGYAESGGPVALGHRANTSRDRWLSERTLPEDLATLRACLFFEQRRFNHFGYPPEGEDDRYVRALVAAIRDLMASPGSPPVPGR